MESIIVSQLLVIFALAQAKVLTRRQSSGADEKQIYHKDFDIPEDQIISLPLGRFPEPKCDYKIFKKGTDNRWHPVGASDSVVVGDPLYHYWWCSSGTVIKSNSSNLFCISVTECTVSNGALKVPLIDEHSCSVDTSIVPDVTYFSDLEAGIKVNAFQMIGTESTPVSFNCQLRIQVKDQGQCVRKQCSKSNERL